MNLHQYAFADEMWSVWKENFTRICDKHAPKKVVKYVTNQILGSMINFYMKNWQFRGPGNYKHARNNYNKLIKNTIKRHWEQWRQFEKNHAKALINV